MSDKNQARQKVDDLNAAMYELNRYSCGCGMDGSCGLEITPALLITRESPLFKAVARLGQYFPPPGWLPYPVRSDWQMLLRLTGRWATLTDVELVQVDRCVQAIVNWAQSEVDETIARDSDEVQGSTLTSGKVPKQPTKKAIQCFQLCGLGRNQTQIAESVYNDGSKQYQVSRDLAAVRAYFAATNIDPKVFELPSKPMEAVVVDPSLLEMGERTDSRTRRQRFRQSDEDEGFDE